jgi:hypothetical protein
VVVAQSCGRIECLARITSPHCGGRHSFRIDIGDCRSMTRAFAISTVTGQVGEIALGLGHGCYANQTRRLLHNPLGQRPGSRLRSVQGPAHPRYSLNLTSLPERPTWRSKPYLTDAARASYMTQNDHRISAQLTGSVTSMIQGRKVVSPSSR